MSSRRSISLSLSGSYESSEDGSDQEGRISSLENRNGNTVNTEARSSDHKPKPYSDQNHLASGKGKNGPKPKRPTHFLCFPLVTHTSVPQLAESLKKFREITTASAKSAQDGAADETPEREIDDPRAASVNGTTPAETQDDRLKVIPASAHRPPGTFHLTIGTMDLSQKSDILRAIRLLKSLDYNSILSKIDQQLSSSTNPREINLDATSMSQTTTTMPRNPNVNNITTTASSPDPYRNTVSKIDRAILHATPNTSFHTANASHTTSYRDTVSKIDRAIMHATPDTRDSRSPKASATTPTNANTPTTTSNTPSHRADLTELFSQQQRNSSQESGLSHLTTSSIAPSVPEPSTVHGNRYGVSGYKETVSTIDRYVDKTYDTAQKAKLKARGLRPSEMRERIRRRGKSGGAGGSGGLESLRRDVSPPASIATTQRRLLSEDGTSMLNGGDGGSLYTVTTNRTDATERPAHARAVLPADVLDSRPVTGGAHPHHNHSSNHNYNGDGDGTTREAEGASGAEASTTPTNTPAQTQHPPNPLTISLAGLSTFPSPNKARVFYAPPLDTEHRLLFFANTIRQIFLDAGVLRDEGRELVLHATVANMTYVSGNRGGKGKWRARGWSKRAETVDAREIIEYFNGTNRVESEVEAKGKFLWADGILVDTVRICKMGAVNAEGEGKGGLGMVYPAVEIEVESQVEDGTGSSANGEKKLEREKMKAEVVFG